MSEINVTPILKQFLLSISGNDIMRTNNDDYTCIDRFLESERFDKALIEANGVKTGESNCNIKCVSNSKPIVDEFGTLHLAFGDEDPCDSCKYIDVPAMHDSCIKCREINPSQTYYC